jgi:signal transduction histidine kinase
MTADEQQRVFEPFYTTKTRGRGTGLGLAIVEHIVRAHGGRIVVESTPGEGTTMRVWLPLEA